MFYTNFALYKNKIYIRYVDENGIRKDKIVNSNEYSPDIFTILSSPNKAPDSYTIYGKPLERVKVNSIWEAREFVKSNKDIDNYPIYGYSKIANQYIHKHFSNNFQYDKIRSIIFDIETECSEGFPEPSKAEQPVNIITLKVLGKETYYSLFYNDIDLEKIKSKCEKMSFKFENLKLIKCKNEKDLLNNFLILYQKINPNIISGWNIIGFDIPYLVNRIVKIMPEGAEKIFSPFGVISSVDSEDDYGNHRIEYSFLGVAILDMLQLYKKFTFKPRDNYKLDTIAEIETGENKLEHHSGIPGHLLYKEYFEDAILYNIQDTHLLELIEQKTNLILLACTLAYKSYVNFDDVFSPMRVWDNLIYIDHFKNNIQYEWNPQKKERRPYAGGYVKDPLIGKYKWVATFDVNSEYPNIIRAMNMSPETIVDGEKYDISIPNLLQKEETLKEIAYEKDWTYGANGQFFKRDKQGVLPKLVKEIFTERKTTKSRVLELKKQIQEIDKELKSRGL